MRWPLVGRDVPLARASALVSARRCRDRGGRRARQERVVECRGEARRAGRLRCRAGRRCTVDGRRAVRPFVHLLPTRPTSDRAETFRLVLGALGERLAAGGVVLAVDDAQHLDDASLGVGHVASLLRLRLGDVDDALVDEAVRASMGNPLVLHELIEGGIGRSIVPDDAQVWRLRGELTESPRLVDLVRSRLDLLAPARRRAIELVSVGAPLPAGILRDAMAR